MLRRHILLVSGNHALSRTRQWVLENSGYKVTRANDEAKVRRVLKKQLDLVLLGNPDDREMLHAIVDAVRQSGKDIPIVSATRSITTGVTARVPALAGPESLLRIVGETIVKSHGHQLARTDCALFVGEDRRYFHVTDRAAEMLGYEREELLGKKIDDIAAPAAQVPRKFAAYVKQGSQSGIIGLRHKSGTIVTVRYAAKVLKDGCMVSRLRKVSESQDGAAS